jgi:type II secretory pathway pseudopilin PulG
VLVDARHIAGGGERGFSLILTVIVVFVVTVMLAGAFDAVFYNVQATRNDLDQKRALLAAQAGLSAYVQRLNTNPDYWETTCTSSGYPTSIAVPGSPDAGGTEYYSYQELPASTAPSTDDKCDTANPLSTMIESSGVASGTFRVKFIGTSGKITRSIVAQFAPGSFLNYVYFTNFEIGDPAATGDAVADCDSFYQSGRDNSKCGGAIDFVTGDAVNGPFHSNDTVFMCGTPSFGGTTTNPDAVQAYAFDTDSNCKVATSPTVNGTAGGATTQGRQLDLPPDDAQLGEVADGGVASQNNGCYAGAGCVFTGPTTLVLSGSSVTVTNSKYSGPNPVTPSNGVIYVNDVSLSSCAATPYNPASTDYSLTDLANCGNATVSGSYSQALTIGADNDIIINGNLVPTGITPPAAPTGTALLGLIAGDFVRIAHPCSNGTNGSADNGLYTSMTNPFVYAAILAVTHSFIVDNWGCGAPLGTLTLWGAIAQNYRGYVGTLDTKTGDLLTGYDKSYSYDTRFASISPPSFLDPVDAGWQVARITECDTTC